MEASFQTTTMMEMHVEGGMMAQHLAHKTPPRVPPKPTSKSPPSFISKAAGRQQSPSPVRHVKGPTPTPARYVSSEQRHRPEVAGDCNVVLHHCCLQNCFALHQTVRLSHQTSQVSHHDPQTGESFPVCHCLSAQTDWSQQVAPQLTVSEPVVVTEHGC